MGRRRTIEIAQHVVFLVVTLGAAAYFAANVSQLGLWAVAGLVIAGAMLTVHAQERGARRGTRQPNARVLGDYAVLLALVAACVLLLLVMLEGLRQRNLVTVVVVGLFLMTFGRILGEAWRSLRRRGRSRSAD